MACTETQGGLAGLAMAQASRNGPLVRMLQRSNALQPGGALGNRALALLAAQEHQNGGAVQRQPEGFTPGVLGSEGEEGALRSPRFAVIPLFAAVLAGTALLRYGSGQAQAVRAVQEALNGLGHDCGPADGIWGPRTDAGMRAFQGSEGLETDGIIGPRTMAVLDAADAGGGGETAPPQQQEPAGLVAAQATRQLFDNGVNGDAVQQLLVSLQGLLNLPVPVPAVDPAVLTYLSFLLELNGPEGPGLVLDEIGRIMTQAQAAVVPAEEAQLNQVRIEALIDFWKQSLPRVESTEQPLDPRRVAVVSTALSQIGAVSAKVPAGVDTADPRRRHFRQGWQRLNGYFYLAYGGSGPGKYLVDDVKYIEGTLRSWCGIFALWACKTVGVLSVRWQTGQSLSPALLGAGWSYHSAEDRSYTPRPGDIVIKTQAAKGHHAIVVSAEGENVVTIDGNTDSSGGPSGGEIQRKDRTKSEFRGNGAGFYSPPY